jgi:hypothetical protein
MSAGVLVSAPAEAATCSASRPSAFCVAVSYQTPAVRSIQVNGRCLTGQGEHPEATVDRSSAPAVQAYGGTACQSGTRVAASARWGNPDAQGYRWVWIS